MSNIASKNIYEALGNDPELDPDREPEPPTEILDKPVQRTGKRNAGAEGPPSGTQRPAGGGRGGRLDNRTDQAGSLNNRAEQRDDGVRQDRHANRTREPREHRGGTDRGGRGGQRGGRGYSGRFQRTNRDDRSNHTGKTDNEKQAAHGWGEEKDGNAEWKDEAAGDAIAKAETNDDPGFTPDTGAGDPAFTNGPGAEGEEVNAEDAPAEPEDNTKSYDQYLAEQAQKRLALGDDAPQVRKANEGSKQKFPEGTAITRNTNEENFFIGGGGKAKRGKAKEQGKQSVALDGQYYAAPDAGDRGGRGRGRGGRGRGEFRGDRGDRGDRGERGDRGDRGERGERGGRGGRGRGEFRGARGDRGEFRGARGDRGTSRGDRGSFNATDESAFPALGGS